MCGGLGCEISVTPLWDHTILKYGNISHWGEKLSQGAACPAAASITSKSEYISIQDALATFKFYFFIAAFWVPHENNTFKIPTPWLTQALCQDTYRTTATLTSLKWTAPMKKTLKGQTMQTNASAPQLPSSHVFHHWSVLEVVLKYPLVLFSSWELSVSLHHHCWHRCLANWSSFLSSLGYSMIFNLLC